MTSQAKNVKQKFASTQTALKPARRSRHGSTQRFQRDTIEIKRLKKECSVSQAQLYGIKMAIDWIQSSKSETSYAIYVDSTSALHATKTPDIY